MRYLICYDVVSNRRRTRLAKVLLDYGVRVQKSAFECEIGTAARLREVLRRAKPFIEEATDSLRVYRICGACVEECRIIGVDFGRPPLEKTVIL